MEVGVGLFEDDPSSLVGGIIDITGMTDELPDFHQSPEDPAHRQVLTVFE